MFSPLVRRAGACTVVIFATAILIFPGMAQSEITSEQSDQAQPATFLTGIRGDGSLALGISASGLRGISASGLRGISASGLRGISASGLRGISASGLRGISASGLRGISASGLRGISASGIHLNGSTHYSQSDEQSSIDFEPIPLVAVAPIDNITIDNSMISVNGQDVIFDEQTVLLTRNNTGQFITLTGLDAIKNLAVGNYIAIAGELIDPGQQLATIVIQLNVPYVDGASPIFLSAILNYVSQNVGEARSGKSTIIYSGALHDRRLLRTEVGDIVEFYGYRTRESSGKIFAINGVRIGNR